MSDEEDYNSEEDADYVPSDGELGSEEENSGDEEDLSLLADGGETVPQTGKRTCHKKAKKDAIAPRKRKGGIKLEGEQTAENTEQEDTENKELVEKIKEEEKHKKEENEKKRADDLWASFLSDVKPPKRPAPSSVSKTTKTPDTKAPASATKTVESSSSNSKPSSDKITITKVFDFAGEEIKVTKEVDINSKEAKAELKKQQEAEESKATASTTATTTTSPSPSAPSAMTKTPASASPASGITGGALGVKRPAPTGGGGLSGVLGKIGKKQKMGTLDKSKLDWEAFKKKEGIEEDLKIHNKGKDGYIERMAFLNRTDLRQFEIERDLRLSKTGKR